MLYPGAEDKMYETHKFDARRAGAIAIALGIAGLGLDAGIAHFAARDMKHAAQMIPVICGPLAMLFVVPFAVRKGHEKIMRFAIRAAGALAVVIGGLGSI